MNRDELRMDKDKLKIQRRFLNIRGLKLGIHSVRKWLVNKKCPFLRVKTNSNFRISSHLLLCMVLLSPKETSTAVLGRRQGLLGQDDHGVPGESCC